MVKPNHYSNKIKLIPIFYERIFFKVILRIHYYYTRTNVVHNNLLQYIICKWWRLHCHKVDFLNKIHIGLDLFLYAAVIRFQPMIDLRHLDHFVRTSSNRSAHFIGVGVAQMKITFQKNNQCK